MKTKNKFIYSYYKRADMKVMAQQLKRLYGECNLENKIKKLEDLDNISNILDYEIIKDETKDS